MNQIWEEVLHQTIEEIEDPQEWNPPHPTFHPILSHPRPVKTNKPNPEIIFPKSDNQAYAKAERLIKQIGIKVVTDIVSPQYTSKDDCITVPLPETFTSPDECYSTIFHELAHSTGTANRLNRYLWSCPQRTAKYTREEINAELISAFLDKLTGIKPDTRHGDYLIRIEENLTSTLTVNRKNLEKCLPGAKRIAKFLLRNSDYRH